MSTRMSKRTLSGIAALILAIGASLLQYATSERHDDSPQSDSPQSAAPRADSTRSDSTRSDSTRSDSTRSDSTRSDSARSDSARSDSARSDKGRSDKGRSDKGRSDKGRSDRRAHKPGEFDYYALVMSWSPTHCASQPTTKTRNDPQCSAQPGGRPYAFVLHGLWPQYISGYPETCWTDFKPYVPKRVINDMLDIMPSTGLIIHEYKKHGTCSGLKPDEYYALSSRAFKQVKIPQRYAAPDKPQMVSPEALVDEFIAANPVLKLRHDMIAVSCGGAGNRLREVRICMSKDGAPRPCGKNEDQRRLCSASRMFVPPVRVSAATP